MKKITTIYEDGEHKWYIVARDPEKPDYLIDTNEYLITSSEGALLTDPGGIHPYHGLRPNAAAPEKKSRPRDLRAFMSPPFPRATKIAQRRLRREPVLRN